MIFLAYTTPMLGSVGNNTLQISAETQYKIQNMFEYLRNRNSFLQKASDDILINTKKAAIIVPENIVATMYIALRFSNAQPNNDQTIKKAAYAP